MYVLLACLAVALVGIVAGVRWWTWRSVVKRRVVVQLDDGTSFEGVAMSRRGPLLVLNDVTARIPGGSQRLDGAVVVERPRVVFVQVV